MNDNSPVNQLVMAIDMPQGIRFGYIGNCTGQPAGAQLLTHTRPAVDLHLQ